MRDMKLAKLTKGILDFMFYAGIAACLTLPLSLKFIGNYLRLIVLDRYGLREQLLEESIDYFEYMADKTNTLWENDTDYASCNHGFASYVICWIIGCK